MSEVRVVEIHESIFSENDKQAELIRQELTDKGIFFINVMSSPGSGKTTLLSSLINMLKDELTIGEMDVDIETSLDAQRVADNTGIRSMQIHNCGLCHIDADMTRRAIDEFGIEGLDLLILENIGNLVCPAEFDTGAHKNICLLSVPEGDDKPLKYPLMFQVTDLVIITKTDTKEFFEFDFNKARDNIRRLNTKAEIIEVSAKTGEGMEALAAWICKERRRLREENVTTT